MRFFNLFTPAHTEIVRKKSIDAVLCGRSKRPQNRTNATPCSSDVYNIGTRVRRRLADVRLSGRSMVEMLGVLAIVGVLSVGAISGYSKAMFKYKLNKQAEAVNTLINNVLQIKGQLGQGEANDSVSMYYTSILEKLGLIPDGFTHPSKDSVLFKDIFNNDVWVFANMGGSHGGIGFRFFPSDKGRQICYTLVETSKANSENLWRVYTKKKSDDTESVRFLYGDRYCGNTLKCLSSLSISDLDDLCNICEEGNCSYYVLWHK